MLRFLEIGKKFSPIPKALKITIAKVKTKDIKQVELPIFSNVSLTGFLFCYTLKKLFITTAIVKIGI